MSTKDQSPATLLKLLQHKQDRRTVLLTRVEKCATKLERRKRKLQAIEARIAELERRVAHPSKRRSGKSTGRDALRQAQLIFNPSSGRNDADNAARLAQIVNSLRAHGIEPRIGLKTSGKAAVTLAHDAVEAGAPLLIVAGGDGTIEDVAAQLVGSQTPLGIIPIGTMNNLSKSLGIPLDIDGACALIAMGTTRHIDIGRVRANDSPENEYFLECAGVGLSAIGALAGQAFEKHRWRTLPRALRSLFDTKLDTMLIELDGTVIEASTRIVTVSNAPYMGSNLLLAPGAKMDDGFLDVCLYDHMGNAALGSHFVEAASPHPHHVKIVRARKIKITAGDPVLSNSDLTINTAKRVVEIDLLPGAVLMIVGNGIGLSLPVESAPALMKPAPGAPSTNGADHDGNHAHAPSRA